MPPVLPKISVLMPFRNCEAYLDESIQSILNQTFKDFELILINDASTDQSDAIVHKYLSDPRLRYFPNQKRLGIANNLNFALSIAKGDYVARMDGDDISAPSRLEQQFHFIQEKNFDLVGTFATIFDSRSLRTSQQTEPEAMEDIRNQIFKRSPIIHSTILAKKAIFGGFPYRPDYFPTEDHDLFVRLIAAGFRLGNLPRFLYFYRWHPENTFNQHCLGRAKTHYRIRREMISRYHWKVGLEDYFIMYADLLLAIFPKRFRLFCEKSYRRLFYPDKH
jgi:glycosyltransferase involved in cell wall biosynthesis